MLTFLTTSGKADPSPEMATFPNFNKNLSSDKALKTHYKQYEGIWVLSQFSGAPNLCRKLKIGGNRSKKHLEIKTV